MKYSPAFKRDAAFYWRNRRKFTFFGNHLPEIQTDRQGVDGVRCFFDIDSRGKYRPTRHPRIVRALLRTKKSVNWQISDWADGAGDMGEPLSYYMAEFNQPPDWVLATLRNQFSKAMSVQYEKYGKVPVLVEYIVYRIAEGIAR